MKTLIYRKHLVIYTDEADKLNKIGKLNRGDLKGFIFVSDSIIHHFIDEKKELESQLEEAREENKKLKSEVFVIMRSGANSDFPVSFKHTKEEADSEALKLDKQEKFFPHYVEQLKEKGDEQN